MLPYILIAAGLGILLTMVMYMRLAKRQEDVQKGLLDATAANDEAMRVVRKKADAAESAIKQTAEQFHSSLAAQEPVMQDVRTRIEGAETRFARFEKTLESTARRALEVEEVSKRSGGEVASSIEALQDEAKTLGAAVQSLRNTSDKRLAEFAARLDKVERTLGMIQKKPKRDLKPKPTASKRKPEPEPDAEKPAPEASSVISAMAAPSVLAAQKAARKAATTASEPAPEAARATPATRFDEEEDDEIDEGSARWIFVVLGLMLALAVIANVASR